jgi:probable rRNA maturation factor
MRIVCNEDSALSPELMDKLQEGARVCLGLENFDDAEQENMEISLSFVDLDTIEELNTNYRGVEAPTDVLSFPLIEDFDKVDFHEDVLLGDVVICMDKVRSQAEEFGHSEARETVYLFVHSLCHLLGYDHIDDDDKAEMRSLEEKVMSQIDLER